MPFIGKAAASSISDNSITTAKIADDAVTAAKIADDAVTAAKIAAGAIPSGVNIASSTPSPTAEGTLHYNTTLDILYVSNGSAWVPISNTPPATTGGTVTIPAQAGLSTFSYNLGLNFTDDTQTDADLVYTLESGTLPAGAVLPTAGNSALTGTATSQATATYNFVIRATDGSGAFSTQAYTQVISQPISATGGTVTTAGGYKYHTFTSSGTFAVSGGPSGADIAIIAGGGSGGGSTAGGGGAGGFIESDSYSISGQNYTITIGAGAAAPNATGLPGVVGSNTVAFGQTALGGGGGASVNNGGTAIYAATAGGSGGGGCGWVGSTVTPGAAGTSGQGNAGGNPIAGQGGAGGGGKMVAGASTSAGGGDGKNWKSLGTYYAGGGGGSPTYPSGGAGGGGAANSTDGGNGTSGTANTGGGGGGAYYYASGVGGAGGSGIVIIRYAV